MKTTYPEDLKAFFTASAQDSAADRLRWYFDRYWLEVAEQHGYPYPAAFPEDSDLAVAHNAAFNLLIADIKGAK